jgi:hypothetical protein
MLLKEKQGAERITGLSHVNSDVARMPRGVIKSESDGHIQACRFYLDDESAERIAGLATSILTWLESPEG